MKTLVIGNEVEGYGEPFEKYGDVTYNPTPLCAETIMHDLVVLIGGNDVDPSQYQHSKFSKTYSDILTDIPCKIALQDAKANSIPVVGICKGAQQVCVWNGGKLFQDIDGHEGRHEMILSDSLFYEVPAIPVTSSHHQMMDLSTVTVPYHVLAWTEPLSETYVSCPNNGKGPVIHSNPPNNIDPEVVFFPDTKQLAVQYHPEWMTPDSHGYILFQELIEEYLLCPK